MMRASKFGTDDATGCDNFEALRIWFDELKQKGPLYVPLSLPSHSACKRNGHLFLAPYQTSRPSFSLWRMPFGLIFFLLSSAMPARLGGMGVLNPTQACKFAHEQSLYVTEPLIDLIMCQSTDFDPKVLDEGMSQLRNQVDKESEARHKANLEDFLKRATPELVAAVKIASEKGASSWITAIPTFEHGTRVILLMRLYPPSTCVWCSF
jgi:hypothetical protein